MMDKFVHDLQTILSSNAPPSCDEATSLRRLLQQEESTFSTLFESINQLQAHLTSLVEQHRDSQIKVQQYRAALSSARVLPPELVRRIFIHCVEEPPITWPPSPGRLPLSLAQICSGWREVALSTPELWSNINFRANSLRGIEKFKELAELWLSRCRIASASVAFTTNCHPERFSNPLGDVIARNSSSIGVLELHLPTTLFNAFSDYPPEAFPRLRTLRLHGLPIYIPMEGGYRLWNSDFSPFQFAPHLTDVVISIPKTRLNLEALNLPWSRLSSLHLAESVISPDAMLRVLDKCSSLTSCSARLFADNEITTPNSEVNVPALTSLSLQADAGELNEFFRYITLPVIQTLSLHAHPSSDWDTQGLMHLISRSQCRLASLTISGRTLEADGFIDLLHAMPAIQELELMFVSFVNDDILGQMSPMTVHEDPIVPNLRAFRCREMSLKCSPNCVRRFIAARGWPVEEWKGWMEVDDGQRQKIHPLEQVVMRSKMGHFGSQWTEKLLEFQNRGLDLSYEERQKHRDTTDASPHLQPICGLKNFKTQKPATQNYPRPQQYRDTPPQAEFLGQEYTLAQAEQEEVERVPTERPKRNEVGVQLLSRQLHSQLFRNTSFTPPSPAFIQIAKEHLGMHNLDPAQGSQLPDTAFRLPPLQGANLDEHFYRLGSHAAEPWLQQAKTFASIKLPPRPEHWDIRSGWTKYTYVPDGASYSEPVDFPMHEGNPEQMLVFDVETMPNYHPYAIMACAATSNAWYTWISPWLLQETEDPVHLIPLGEPNVPRVVVGHNVSYDRQRILDEYNITGSATRFLDTMALHVAVTGISSHQRPEWMKYRKSKEKQLEQQEEAIEVMYDLISQVEEREKEETDPAKREEMRNVRDEMLQSVNQLAESNNQLMEEQDEIAEKRWEELTSVNSLREVANLHCGVSMDKEIRSDFMTSTPQDIRDNIHDYLDYCSSDVDVTHRVYAVTLPAFLQACPHPVTFAGILEMGSSFLTVNQEWERYLERAEGLYREMEEGIKQKLRDIAEGARTFLDTPDAWQDDPWLSQLDWTPKVAKKSRGVFPPAPPLEPEPEKGKKRRYPLNDYELNQPIWVTHFESFEMLDKDRELVLPFLLRMAYRGHVLRYDKKEKWHYIDDEGNIARPETFKGSKIESIWNSRHISAWIKNGDLTSYDNRIIQILMRRKPPENRGYEVVLMDLSDHAQRLSEEQRAKDPWLSLLDWRRTAEALAAAKKEKEKKSAKVKAEPVYWPQWYWDAAKPKKGKPPGSLEITVRNRIAPILLRLSWLGFPLFHSREHGWTYRVPFNGQHSTRSQPLSFYDDADKKLAEMTEGAEFRFYKVPHKDGESKNVGSPLSKTFIKYAQDGILQSPGEEAREALHMNAQCSYWISARDRIMNQMVVWQNKARNLGFSTSSKSDDPNNKWGIIIPQVITMGAVTRRAIEKTWLTASNAKQDRVGSELKAMIRAPPGYAIVGADVDSEELWISSCMGDAQFGLHGATALGWMTLEGTKAAGTDLHSKTASILGISRNAAKVFNYSRIYGAGQKHAQLLLLQSNPSMEPEQAQKLAQNLYASTKGKNTHQAGLFGRKFWYGGSESYVFNKLEEIALSDHPQTPALECGITHALSKKYLPERFGSDYMTSRINWVVQSSGVDYLHLLIVSMQHLIKKYDIQARYLISVHDELRYLVKEEDKYRAALALQIANLWTRSLFAYKLGMDDLPQGVAFFSAVDVDHVLRKEVDMPCVTPSQPNPIPPGESLDITQVLEKTNGGTLMKDGSSMKSSAAEGSGYEGHLEGYVKPECMKHRSQSAEFLKAQATNDFNEIKGLAQLDERKRGVVKPASRSQSQRKLRSNYKKLKKIPLGNGDIDFADVVDRLLNR
ncbi:hypothetical protein NP233_g1401 [Leucocoprinus birnbaumii]|uniref:DNA-directed DNA polymerase n=1 Tax=Leucocoprinus birnbaumii TaxID=56174 RepID=A0AAD5W0D9_9AGAR|nr:hypothetical protein NP233_g1401 [Leucocoprinus birnbaumii]